MDLKSLKKRWERRNYYADFEQVILSLLLVFLGLIAVYMVVLVAIQLVEDVQLGSAFMDKAVLQDTFGNILTVLIVLEFSHSVAVAIRQKTGAIQVRMVVFIAILVVVRKLMLLDYSTVTSQVLLGFSGLLLALGGVQWLLAKAEARHDGAHPPAHGTVLGNAAVPSRQAAEPPA